MVEQWLNNVKKQTIQCLERSVRQNIEFSSMVYFIKDGELKQGLKWEISDDLKKVEMLMQLGVEAALLSFHEMILAVNTICRKVNPGKDLKYVENRAAISLS